MLETKALIDQIGQSGYIEYTVNAKMERLKDDGLSQYSRSENGCDASFPFRCHLQVPRCPDRKQYIQKI